MLDLFAKKKIHLFARHADRNDELAGNADGEYSRYETTVLYHEEQELIYDIIAVPHRNGIILKGNSAMKH